uniref:Homogentisate 1,2-dioxygenase n=1 Tax=Angiostrongylus cantonensis TaxID=6313 RepID=A0A0K0D4H0_ANGCA
LIGAWLYQLAIGFHTPHDVEEKYVVLTGNQELKPLTTKEIDGPQFFVSSTWRLRSHIETDPSLAEHYTNEASFAHCLPDRAFYKDWLLLKRLPVDNNLFLNG